MDIIMKKLRNLLAELDSLSKNEDVEELTATLEDVILMLEDADDDDLQEMLEDAMDELDDIATSFHDMDMDKYADEIFGIIGIMESI